jgi:hypothetical protein
LRRELAAGFASGSLIRLWRFPCSRGSPLGRSPVCGNRPGRALQANGRGAATGCVRKDRTARNANRLVSHSLQARWHNDRPGACVHRESRNRAAMVGRRQLPLPAWYRWLDAKQYCLGCKALGATGHRDNGPWNASAKAFGSPSHNATASHKCILQCTKGSPYMEVQAPREASPTSPPTDGYDREPRVRKASHAFRRTSRPSRSKGSPPPRNSTRRLQPPRMTAQRR